MEMVFLKDRRTAQAWQAEDIANISLFNLYDAVAFGKAFFIPLLKYQTGVYASPYWLRTNQELAVWELALTGLHGFQVVGQEVPCLLPIAQIRLC